MGQQKSGFNENNHTNLYYTFMNQDVRTRNELTGFINSIIQAIAGKLQEDNEITAEDIIEQTGTAMMMDVYNLSKEVGITSDDITSKVNEYIMTSKVICGVLEGLSEHARSVLNDHE